MCIGLGLLIGLPVGVMADNRIAVDELEVIVPEADALPMDQSEDNVEVLLPKEDALTEQDIFGLEGGYIHPYLQVQESYLDNIFQVDKDTTSSWITTLAPGIWVSLPRTREVPVSLARANSSPGGLVHQIKDDNGGGRFQLYGLAGMAAYLYSDDSAYNFEDYYLEGMGRYNMPSGLSLQLLNRYDVGHDIFQTATDSSSSDNIREYDSNLLMLTGDWDITPKLRFRVDYSNFYLSYDDNINEFLDRQDNTVDFYTFYRYTVKTSFFLQYRYANVVYDSDSARDNNQNFYYGGIQYKSTDKLDLRYKIGWQDKRFNNENGDYSDDNNLAMDLMAAYNITEKTTLTMDLYRLNEESDSSQASDQEVLGVKVGYKQQINDRITALLTLRYENADYSQFQGDPGREDDNYFIRPAMQYAFRDWLSGEISYAYEQTDSTDDEFDYEANLFTVSLAFAL